MNKNKLREFAISQILFRPTTLARAIDQLGFVQMDPVRSPARAQDLILRHRVAGYRAGDAEKNYPALNVEEDYLYAYGYMPRDISNLWHPKKVGRLSAFDKKVLEAAREMGEINPKKLEEYFGKKTVRNWWGGRSRAAKHSLDILNYWGFVKVVRREKGQRVYKVRQLGEQKLTLAERKMQLILAIIKILSPVTERKLGAALHFLKQGLGDTKSVLDRLIKSGELTKQKIDGVNYLFLAETRAPKSHEGVKILAPFDPLVWDRGRFEHLWGWEYRFEAYTPAPKRVRGYYAMPLLWNNNVIGWANAKKDSGKLNVDFGYVNGPPSSKEFQKALEEEIENLNIFLLE